jgi:spermidine synthase
MFGTPPKPFVHQDAVSKSLHFTYGQLQSRMLLARPDELVLDYTRTMMGFLLVNPQPRRIAMVGLGGGSLAKYCHKHLPQAELTVVEIDPQVVALRREFQVPDDGPRFRVLVEDGAQFVQRAHSQAFDVLLVDGFDHHGQSPQLCTQAFYSQCQRVLAPGGLLVVNLHQEPAEFARYSQRLRAAFGTEPLEMPTLRVGNSVLFARKDVPLPLRDISRRANGWCAETDGHPQLQPEFLRMGWALGDPALLD